LQKIRKSSFHRSINATFGKVGRIASEEALLDVVKGKYTLILLHGLDASFCPYLTLNTWTLLLLDFFI